MENASSNTGPEQLRQRPRTTEEASGVFITWCSPPGLHLPPRCEQVTISCKVRCCSSTLAKGRTAEPLRRENKLNPQNTCSRETHKADAKRQVPPKLMGAEAGSPAFTQQARQWCPRPFLPFPMMPALLFFCSVLTQGPEGFPSPPPGNRNY